MTRARTQARPWAASLAVAAALVAAGVSPAQAAHVEAGAPSAQYASSSRDAHRLPDQVAVKPRVRQLVTVTSRSFGSTTARLEAWRRGPEGPWRLARGPVKAVLGYNGWVKAEDRRQSTGTTPAGRFTIPSAFGRLRDPGARLPYRRVDHNDWWPYEPRDPATYNVYQTHKARGTHWRSDKAERLDSYTEQYGYALVVGFNLPGGVHFSPERHQYVATRRADTSAGGGIFLHVRGDGLTAGCVAMRRAEMRWLLGWLRPAAHPRLLMGPRSYIRSL